MGQWVTGTSSRVLIGFGALVATMAMAAPAWGSGAGIGPPPSDDSRYTLANGCFALGQGGSYAVKAAGGYESSAGSIAGAEPFRMQATDLGRYLLYDSDREFLADSGLINGQPVTAAGEPSNAADWTITEDGGGFEVTNASTDRQLAVGSGGTLIAVAEGSAGAAGRFTFASASGCPQYPEIEVNASGGPVTGSPAYGEVTGMAEGHMHGMAFEFLGGKAHCGRPWHRFGAPAALVDCVDHEVGNGCGAVLENVLYGNPARCHDPGGWPTFAGWPDPKSLTHEQSYYKWLERAWRGGMRLYVNLMVENRVLCELYPLKQNDCDEMESVLLQIERIHELEDYIDAQNGGPGEGWFRIVDDPFEAREVINEGKMAVVQGMEVSEPFGCREFLGTPQCDADDIDDWLDQLHGLGIRQLEIVNKFDNALTGVAGDSGNTGAITNTGNFASTGSFWDLEQCSDPDNHDHSPTAIQEPHHDDLVIANGLDELGGPVSPPVYPAAPHCNTKGLTPLGEHTLDTIMDKRMIFDPDHMSVLARNQALSQLEAEGYPGVTSSHSWSTPNALPRIYGLGGVVTPSPGSSEGFVEKWLAAKEAFNGDQYFGIGIGADQNGFASQPDPRGAGVPNPVTYPFESFDGEVTLDQQQSGDRTYDINVDGVAHYGLYPDWVEDLRMLAGDEIVDDLGRGAEAYLQTWERTEGIDPVRCGGWKKQKINKRGLGRLIRLGYSPSRLLERAGQPVTRDQGWRFCAGEGRDDTKHRVAAAFTDSDKVGLVLSTLRKHSAGGVKRGMQKDELKGIAERLTRGLWVQDAGRKRKFVYGVGKRVRFVGVASRKVASSPQSLRQHLKLANAS